MKTTPQVTRYTKKRIIERERIAYAKFCYEQKEASKKDNTIVLSRSIIFWSHWYTTILLPRKEAYERFIMRIENNRSQVQEKKEKAFKRKLDVETNVFKKIKIKKD